MATWSGSGDFGCGHLSCAHLACRQGATGNAVNLGRREFLKETAATAGFAGLVLSGCETAPPVQPAASPADILVTNAKIATLNPKAPAANAIAVRSGEIAAIGTAAGSAARPRHPGDRRRRTSRHQA
jgi:hypothetical protein